MLSIPQFGIRRSINAHNVDADVCCDWIEASALFQGGSSAGSDLVDLLHENEIYADQGFAWELVADMFSRIRERGRLIGAGYPFVVENNQRVRTVDNWKFYPAYSFCLLLSLARGYPQWARTFGRNHSEQGRLFEQLTAESMGASLAGWTIHSTGWSPTAPQRLGTLVKEIANMLGEATGEVRRWTRDTAKEAGLDLLCFLPFPDRRVGVPVYLTQCASGGDWEGKLNTPNLNIWTKVIIFVSRPKKAFSMPFALDSENFIRHCNVVNGLLLDRHRLLAPGINKRDWVSDKLAGELVAWITPRVDQLPSAELS